MAKMPRRIRPMLAKRKLTAFDKAGWLFEIKWDGYRAIAEIENGRVNLYSRNGISLSDRYPAIVNALLKIRHDAVIDGEIIALKDGHPDFHALQNYERQKSPLQYAVFDLLYLDGADMREEPLIERKAKLKEILPDDAHILFSEHVEENGISFFETMRERGLEGMVAKNSSSSYKEGSRNGEWQKVKTKEGQEAIIVGFTAPQGSRAHLGSLVLAAHEGGKLHYVGHSGGGFAEDELKDLYERLNIITVKKPPIDETFPINSPITWVKPQYVCEVQFTEWTPDGRMRHPIYKGLREDKELSEVTIEKPARLAHSRARKSERSGPLGQVLRTFSGSVVHQNVELGNLDKVFWPIEGYTKGDVIDYYDRIAPIILPYLKGRPQNLNRHPDGINGEHFYHKNFDMRLPPFVRTELVWSESNQENNRHIVCDNKETLLYMANLGCIEINPWNSRAESLENPDYLILDLDPNGRPFNELIEIAEKTYEILIAAGAESYPKTSGKSGVHIVVPLNARFTYEDVRSFAEIIMRLVHKRAPGNTSVERNPSSRKNKIYLDYMQNRFGQTLACAYSLRPYPGALVSTPLEWREVRKGLDPSHFNIKTIWKRLEEKGDLWKPVLKNGLDLKKSLRRLEKWSLGPLDSKGSAGAEP